MLPNTVIFKLQKEFASELPSFPLLEFKNEMLLEISSSDVQLLSIFSSKKLCNDTTSVTRRRNWSSLTYCWERPGFAYYGGSIVYEYYTHNKFLEAMFGLLSVKVDV